MTTLSREYKASQRIITRVRYYSSLTLSSVLTFYPQEGKPMAKFAPVTLLFFLVTFIHFLFSDGMSISLNRILSSSTAI